MTKTRSGFEEGKWRKNVFYVMLKGRLREYYVTLQIYIAKFKSLAYYVCYCFMNVIITCNGNVVMRSAVELVQLFGEVVTV